MGGVTEHRPSGQRYFSNLVTFNAISGYGKSVFAVVAAAAGFPQLHLGHGDVRIGLVRFIEGVMAIRTGVHAEMNAVFESQRSEIGYDHRYFINLVTAGTVFQLRSFWIILVVASAARFPLFHFSHGNGAIVLTVYMENGIVTGATVVVQTFEMIFMAEGNVSGVPAFNM